MEFVKSKIVAVAGALLPIGFEYLASDTPDYGWVVVPALCLGVAGYLLGASCYAIFHSKWSSILWLVVYSLLIAAAVWQVGLDSLKRSSHDHVRTAFRSKIKSTNSSKIESLMRDALSDFEKKREARRKESLKQLNGPVKDLMESRFESYGGLNSMEHVAVKYVDEEANRIEQHYSNFFEFLKQVSAVSWGAFSINLIFVLMVTAIASIWLSGILTFLIAKFFL